MTLQKSVIPVNLTDGIDTKSDEKLAVKLSVMENCSHQGKGTPRKRKQLSSLPKNIEGGGTITNGKYSFGYNNQALVASNNSIYVFIESSQLWRKIEDLSLSTLQGEFVKNTGFTTSEQAGMVKTEKEEAYVTVSEAGANNSVFIRDTGSGVVTNSFSTGFDPRLIQVNNEIISVSWAGGILTDLVFRNHTTGVTTTPIVDTSGRFDITTDGVNIYVVYNTATLIRVYKLNTDGTIASTQTYAIGADVLNTSSNPSIFYDGATFHITFIVNRGAPAWCRYFSIDNTLAVVTAQLDNFQFINNAANVLSSIVVGTTGDTLLGPLSLYFFYNDRTSSKSAMVELSLTNFLSLGITERSGLEIVSKPFVYEDTVMVLSKMNLPENINWVLIDKNYNPQGMVNNFDTTIINSFAVNTLNSISPDFEVAYIDDGKFLKKSTIDFSFKASGDFVEFGGSTFLPGSLPIRYNGLSIVESQFLGRPEIISIIAAGGGVPADTYDYVCTYEYTEPNGNIVRSEPSEQFQIITAGLQQMAVEVRTLKLSFILDAEILIRVYRKTVVETVFRLVSTSSVNDRTVDTVIVNDNDASLSGNEALYTTGELLPNQTMPAILSYGFSNNRLFGVRAEDSNEILYSNKYVIGEGVFFNNFNTINVEDNQNRRSDKVTTIVGMDNKLIIFKRNSILAIFGDGPDAAGLNGVFSEPELVTTDVGCINARSVSITNDGTVFKSAKGIHLLARSMQSVYIGAPVEAFNGLQISGAILMEDINQVRWTTFDGSSVVYDYYYKQWSVFSNFNSLGCFIHKGKMAIIKADGSFLVEGENYSDDGTFIKQKVTTGWLKVGGVSSSGKSVPGGIQEFQRVYRMLILGEYKSVHKMLVKVYYDFHEYADHEYLLSPTDENYERTDKPLASDIETGGNDGTYQYNVHLRRQKCQAIKISIEDVQDGSPGESYELTGITFVVGKKKGAFKTREGVAN